MSTMQTRHQAGFGMIAAIVILVILAGLAGFVVSITVSQNISFSQDLQGARAYQAARAGTEWGIAQAAAATPVCASTTSTIALGDLGFSFEVVGTETTSGGLRFCELVSVARPTGMTAANVGAISYIERQLRVVIELLP